MNGTQFYLELLDRDSKKNDLIDRFAINISVPVNSFIERANYSGVFGMAMLEVSFHVISNSSTTESSPTVVTSTESGPTAVISPTVAISTESDPTVVTSTESGPTVVISPTVVSSTESGPTVVTSTESGPTVVTSTESGPTTVISPAVGLQVTFYSFSNPNGRLIKQNRCCEDGAGEPCSDNLCDSFFSFCLRSIEAPVSQTDEDSNIDVICSNTDIISTPPMTDVNSARLSNSIYILPNLYGPLWVRKSYFR